MAAEYLVKSVDGNPADENGNAVSSGGGGSLTDGSGTTANGTAVDLGGSLTVDANILTQGHDFYIRDNTSASALRILDTDSYLGDVAGSSNGTLVHVRDNGNQIILANTANTALVGINNTTPTVALDIAGDIKVDSPAISQIGDISGNSSNLLLSIDNTSGSISIGKNSVRFGVNSDGTIEMGDPDNNISGTTCKVDPGNNAVYIDEPGHATMLGINTSTPDATKALVVVGDATISGKLTLSENLLLVDITYTVPTNGANFVSSAVNIIEPAGALTNITIRVPDTPENGQVARYTFTQDITTIVFISPNVGINIINPVTSITAGQTVGYIYYTATNNWYRF